MMELQFLGATGTVTGSKYLVTSNSLNFLIDCGLFQGFKELRLRNRAPLSVEASSINAVVLTHAHLDHSGYIPLLIKNGFRGKIFCTPATYELCHILLPDSGFLQEEEARFANKHGFSKHKPALPLYTQEDGINSLDYFEPIAWHQDHPLTNQLSFKFIPSGHLLGAASVRLQSKKTSILFSGDLGRPHDPVMNAPAPPEISDYMVVESTYGDRNHPVSDPKEVIQDIVNQTIKRGGTLLIPSFAVGRAQLILYYLHQLKKEALIPDVPIFLNSPMATNANFVFEKYIDDHRLDPKEARAVCAGADYINSIEESKALNERKEPAIIIAASGMATGGRILHHLKAYVTEAKNSVLFVGYQAGGTRGEAMIHGAAEIKIHGQYWPVRAEIKHIDNLSAHADRKEILSWLKSCPKPPRKIFLTHGEPPAVDSLRRGIEEDLNWNCHVPYFLERVDLT